MPSRLIASFLVLLVLWSGFASWEQWTTCMDDLPRAVAMVPGSPLDDGSVADHHLDDQPAQSPSDAAGNAPAVLPSPWRITALDRRGEHPPAHVQRLPDSPFLEGLRRPPRLA